MLRLADDALDVLAAILRDEKASNGIRLKAASVILDRVGINPPASSAAVSRDQSREHAATWSLEDEELLGVGLLGQNALLQGIPCSEAIMLEPIG